MVINPTNVTYALAALPVFDGVRSLYNARANLTVKTVAEIAAKAFYRSALFAASAFTGAIGADKLVSFASAFLPLSNAYAVKAALVVGQIALAYVLSNASNKAIKEVARLAKVDTYTVKVTG